MADRWFFGLLVCVMTLLHAQVATPHAQTSLPTDPSAFIHKLYDEVTWYHPLEILNNEYVGRVHPRLISGVGARKRFMPYLSTALRHRIALNDACMRDLAQQYRSSPVPMKLPVFEGGIFSGAYERGEPNHYRLDKLESRRNGSFRAFITLSHAFDQSEKDSWHVEVLLGRHEKALGVEDVIYIRDANDPGPGERLSAILSSGCDGSPWADERSHSIPK